jgi:hypothetical protein
MLAKLLAIIGTELGNNVISFDNMWQMGGGN